MRLLIFHLQAAFLFVFGLTQTFHQVLVCLSEELQSHKLSRCLMNDKIDLLMNKQEVQESKKKESFPGS
jgi:hypothetical protein